MFTQEAIEQLKVLSNEGMSIKDIIAKWEDVLNYEKEKMIALQKVMTISNTAQELINEWKIWFDDVNAIIDEAQKLISKREQENI